MKTLFTKGRRIWLANTFKNVILIIIATGFASKFFADFAMRFRVTAVITLALLFTLGFMVCPEDKVGE